MKICHFLPWYSPANIGGTEIYIVKLSKELQQLGHEVLIICPSINDETSHFTVEGVPVIASAIITLNPGGEVATGKVQPKKFDEFCSFLQGLNVDVLHCHCLWPKHIFYLEAARKLGIITLVTPHIAAFSCLKYDLIYKNTTVCDGTVTIKKCTDCLYTFKSRNSSFILLFASLISNIMFKININVGVNYKICRAISVPFLVKNQLHFFERVQKHSNAVVALSKWYCDLLYNNKFNYVVLIETNVDVVLNEYLKYEDHSDVLKIVFAGRQSIEKGLGILLEAITLVDKEKVELHIFGHQYGDNGLQAKIQSMKENGYTIVQYGSVANTQMLEHMRIMDVLCFPSNMAEMAPLTIKEALALGIPVIGSNIGGIKDSIIDGENGYLFKLNDATDLATKISKLVNDRQNLTKLRLNISAKHSAENFTLKYNQLYTQLLKINKNSGV